jgi:DNA-binding CsgD family transcriptional regulator
MVIEKPEHRPRADLAADIAAVLTPAECAEAIEFLNCQRPTEIAARRNVSIETVGSQIKRIYAKADVAGSIEFLEKTLR